MNAEKDFQLKMFLNGEEFCIHIENKGFSKTHFEKEWKECNKSENEAIETIKDGKKIYYKSLTESFDELKKDLGYSKSECCETLSFMLERDLERNEYHVSYFSDNKKGEFIYSTFWAKEDGNTLENIIKEELAEIL